MSDLFQNHYRCESCDYYWHNAWESQCNDQCTMCRAEVEPFESEPLDFENN
jgi:hypothetical protein